MARSDKTAAVAEIVDAFRASSAAVLTEYRGLTVSQLTELRRSMGSSAKYTVVKNTLTKIAAQEAGLTGLDELLNGPTAVAFISGDPVEAAKGLRDFSKANPLLIIKGGVLDGAPVTTAEINRLADLESREVLLAKLAGAMNGSLVKAVTLLSAPLSKAARLLEALRQQREANGESIPAAETAQAEATAEVVADPAVETAAESADAAPAASAE
jgi:large subunit ribosomal protein L10